MFQVLTRKACEKCEGTGFVINAVWVDWLKRQIDEPPRDTTYQTPCKKCSGSGGHEQWLTAQEIIEAAKESQK